MQVIASLTLTQDRVDTGEDTTVIRWYGWSTGDGTTWGERPTCLAAGRGPDYACDVTLPAILAGDVAEVRADIAAALRRHAATLGL